MNNPKFEFTGALKKNLFIMMGVGLLGIAYILAHDFITGQHNHHARLWANLLANTYYFTGIGLFGMFVVAAAQLAYGGWHTLTKRIFLSLSAFAVVGGFILTAILALGVFGHVHTLYEHVEHILHTGHGDPKYTTKLVFYAPWFWIGRVFLYACLWAGSSYVLNNFFARTDQTNPRTYKMSKLLSAAFIVIFAVTESAVSWDMIMSIDPHWYSTLFGWYNFASYGCAAWAMTILLVVYLKSKGYLEQVNENHVHDLGKMLFGFSIFWTYLWFDQFMLQWYANMPEETHFWYHRFNVPYFKLTVFGALIINFVFPLFVLIRRGAKRNFKLISFGAVLLIFGHYVDFFNYTFVEPNWNGEAKHHLKEQDQAAQKAVWAGDDVVTLNGHGAESTHAAAVTTEESKAPAETTESHTADHTTDAMAEQGEESSAAVAHITEETTTGGEAHKEETHEAEGAATHTADHSTDAHADAATTEHGNMTAHAPAKHGEGEHGAAGHDGEHVVNFAGIGVGEILVFFGFLGMFLFMFFNNLSKRPIVPESDPYLKEAEKLTVTYS